MSHRLEKQAHTVTWSESLAIVVGHHDCNVCGAETPQPTTDVLIEHAKRFRENNLRGSGCYLWPASDPRDGWQPPGWQFNPDALLCPDCVSVKNAALDTRRKK